MYNVCGFVYVLLCRDIKKSVYSYRQNVFSQRLFLKLKYIAMYKRTVV